MKPRVSPLPSLVLTIWCVLVLVVLILGPRPVLADPLFHVVSSNEFGLSGPFNREPGVGNAGFDWGSFRIPTLSMPQDHCAITSGEIKIGSLPPNQVYQAKFLMFDLSIVNTGTDWVAPNPRDNPELFTTWACENPNGRKQLADFVLITFSDADGVVVREGSYPGLFFDDTFKEEQVYFVSNRYPFGGQRCHINDLADGIYKLEIKVNPRYGQSVAASGWIQVNDQDLKIVPQPQPTFPLNLKWKTFAPK